MVNVYRVKGQVFNITLNDRVVQKGWYLLVTDLGQEYLVQRNYSLSSKRFCLTPSASMTWTISSQRTLEAI